MALSLVFCFFFGKMLGGRLKQRVRLLTAFSILIKRVKSSINYCAVALPEVFEQCGAEADFKELTFLAEMEEEMQNGTDFYSAWEDAIENFSKKNALLQDDITLLKNFGSAVGKSDIDGQNSLCLLYDELVCSKIAEASEKAARSSGLYAKLGLFAGAAVCIVIS
jgi:stage III sporulation protein AB